MAWEKHPRLVQLMNFAPSLTITIMNVVLPFVFKKLCLFEDWSPSFEVTINMCRYVFFIHPLAIFCCIKSLIIKPKWTGDPFLFESAQSWILFDGCVRLCRPFTASELPISLSRSYWAIWVCEKIKLYLFVFPGNLRHPAIEVASRFEKSNRLYQQGTVNSLFLWGVGGICFPRKFWKFRALKFDFQCSGD